MADKNKKNKIKKKLTSKEELKEVQGGMGSGGLAAGVNSCRHGVSFRRSCSSCARSGKRW